MLPSLFLVGSASFFLLPSLLTLRLHLARLSSPCIPRRMPRRRVPRRRRRRRHRLPCRRRPRRSSPPPRSPPLRSSSPLPSPSPPPPSPLPIPTPPILGKLRDPAVAFCVGYHLIKRELRQLSFLIVLSRQTRGQQQFEASRPASVPRQGASLQIHQLAVVVPWGFCPLQRHTALSWLQQPQSFLSPLS